MNGKQLLIYSVFLAVFLSVYIFTFYKPPASVFHIPRPARFIDHGFHQNATATLENCQYLPLNVNPLSPPIKKYVKKLKDHIECTRHESFLFFVDENGILRSRYKPSKEVACYYASFTNETHSDDKIKFSSDKPLYKDVDLPKLGIDFVRIRCFSGEHLVHQEAHAFPSKVERKPGSHDLPSVAILVIESLARLNFLRSMPKTKREFEAIGRYHYNFKGLTKVADNSFVNMVPFLTGLRPYIDEFPHNINVQNGPYDDLPLVWKNFKNFSTAFIEDHPEYTLFNYLGKGFKQRPVDWYPRPYWLYLKKFNAHDSDTLCYKNKVKLDIFLEQQKNFMRRADKFFLYSFYIQATHEDFNMAQSVDRHYAKFISEQKSILNNSIFILMGDHGNRYGDHLITLQGRIEERMPLFALHLPESLVEKYPHIDSYLRTNQDRLSTWLDVHELLTDVAAAQFNPLPVNGSKTRYSLMREEIPTDRTCKEALIPENYCVCSLKTEISRTSQPVLAAAKILLTKINEIISSKSKKCKKLSLGSVKGAWVLDKKDLKSYPQAIEIVVEVKPSKAVFSGHLYKTNHTSTWEQKGGISRLSRYSGQAWCTKDAYLKKFCYC